MTSEIYEKEVSNGVIEYGSRHVCKVRRIQVTKLSLASDGIQRVFMTKEYQNNDKKEHDEIDGELIAIYEKNDAFIVNCYDEGYYSCRFGEKPPKGQGILSAVIL